MESEVRGRRALTAAIAVAATAIAAQFGEGARAQAQPNETGIADSVGTPRTGLSREMKSNLFSVPAKPKPAPKKVAAPAAAPKPVAPSFPYKYGGWVAVGAERVHYLQKGNDVVAIGKGQTLDGVWRVDALSDDRIQVSYVPLGQQLSMLLASLTGEPAGQGAVPPAAVASDGYAPARRLSSERAAAPAAEQPASALATPQPAAMSPSVVAGAIAFPQSSSRVSTGARTASITPPAGLGGPASLPTGSLGDPAPRSGSMPTGPASGGSSMPLGAAPTGTMPTSPAPSGKLGH